MGYGDELMALGRAETVYQILEKPVAICGVSHHPRMHEVWKYHPAVDPKSELKILDGPSARPYMLRWKRPGPISVFNPEYRARVGHMVLTDEERRQAADLLPDRPFGLVEPIIRGRSSRNKDWGFKKWAQVVKDLPIPIYQFMVDGEKTKILPGGTGRTAPSFRVASEIVRHATIVMTNDGGMHHLAASVGAPAVVVFGGFADPKITGYPFQTNFYADIEGSPCGNYGKCPHCVKAREMIKPEQVREAVMKILSEGLEGSHGS